MKTEPTSASPAPVNTEEPSRDAVFTKEQVDKMIEALSLNATTVYLALGRGFQVHAGVHHTHSDAYGAAYLVPDGDPFESADLESVLRDEFDPGDSAVASAGYQEIHPMSSLQSAPARPGR